MKKFLLPGAVVLVLFLIPAGIWAVRSRQAAPADQQQDDQRRRTSKPVNEIPVAERPYVVMSPTSNREIEVTVNKLNKDAEGVEFLAEYQYGTSLGGNENFIDLESLPATQEFALYSRSAGGKTSYEEDVKGGTLTLKFQGPEEYWLKQEWNYFDRINPKSSTRDTKMTSRDGKLGIEGDSLDDIRYAIIYMSPGYPAELPGPVKSDLYTVQFAGTTGDTMELSIRMKEAGSGTIYGWDGTQWQSFDTTVTDQVATAEVEILESYIVVGE